jgi:hypothetical protein
VQPSEEHGRGPQEPAAGFEAPFLRLGYWSAVACGAGALAYGALSVVVGLVAVSAITWEGYPEFVAGYSALPSLAVLLPPFVVAVVFPALVLALHAAAPEERRPFALLALVFAGIYTAALGSAYWLQLTYVPWNLMRGAADGVAPWVVWNPASFFWAFETFGYFAMGLACLFAGLAFAPGTIPRHVRRGLLGMGALGLLFLVTAFKDVVLDPTPAGDPAGAEAWANVWALSVGLAWVVLFGFLSLSLARWFARGRAA